MSSAASPSSASGLQSPWLDFARAAAAWLVCFAHIRAFFLVDYEQSNGGLVGSAFYLITGLHHQAVMVFFVLSGYFVGGALVREVQQGSVDSRRYIIKRAARLWVVLVPALALTLMWDRMGIMVAGPAGYEGAFAEILASGPDKPVDLSVTAFLGNVFFLQDVLVPVYGSNGPLWSLAYEGWYYLLALLAAQVAVGRGLTRWLCGAALLAALAFLLARQPAILVLGVNWLFGVLVYLWRRPLGIVWRCGTLVLFAAALVASRFGYGHDLVVGLAFALVLSWLAGAKMRWGERAAFLCADFSYTLYLTHYPLLAFLFFAFADGAQLTFSPTGIGALTALLALCLGYAYLVWWLFERNTGRVRSWLARILPRRSVKPA